MSTNSKKLDGKVAVVTGASKGIGAAIAKALGAGAAVVANYSSRREGADRVVAAIKNSGGRAIAVQGNVSKRSISFTPGSSSRSRMVWLIAGWATCRRRDV